MGINYERLEEIIEDSFTGFWVKTVILDCFNKGMTKEQTIDHIMKLDSFTIDIESELFKRFEQEGKLKK